MLVVMQSHATDEQVRAVCDRIESIGITGNSGAVDLGVLESMAGVIECIPVTKPYKLVSRDVKQEDSIIKIPTPSGDVLVGGSHIAMVAGPCAVETEQQCMTVAEQLKSTGIRLFRGGAYKPRTSPYSFQGLGLSGLKILSHVRKQFGFGIVTEAIDSESLDLVEEYADVIQIGARNMQNFSLLKRAGRAKLPVLLKRGMSATLDEFLMAAEYILSEGNYNVMLCERGVRTFSDFSRNTLDLAVVPAVQKRSHLPILVDPSHGTGKRHKVLPLSRAAIAVGADGLLVEVHHDPETALSDGIQSILPAEFSALMSEVQQIASVLHRRLN
jgi:3-deoxy-7-phosphoheptulonate synthase